MPHKSAYQGLKKKAKKLIGKQMFPEAQAVLLQLATQNPRDADNWFTLGSIAIHEKNYEMAETYYHQATQKAADSPEAYTSLGEAQHVQGKLSSAISSYNRALSLKPDMPQTLCNLGSALSAIGNYPQATAVYNKVLLISPTNASAYYGMAYTQHMQGLLHQAIENYRRVLDIEPDSFKAQVDLGNALLDIGQRNEAISHIQKGLELKPDYAPAYASLGNLLTADIRLKDAITAYQKALELDPNNFGFTIRLADLFLERGIHESSLELLESAVQTQPGNNNLGARLASLYEIIGMLDKAADQAHEVLKTDPDWIPAKLILARIERQDNALEKARTRVEEIRSKTVNPAYAAEIEFEYGHILDRLGAYQEAYKAFSNGNLATGKRSQDHENAKRHYLEGIQHYKAWFTRERVEQWLRTSWQDKLPSPVFLIGFPRSGTTLAGLILASHPSVATLDEKPILAKLRDHDLPNIVGPESGFPGCLDSLSQSDIEFLRRRYWEYVAEYSDEDIFNTLLVDKLPLNLLLLGLVCRLFPQAKIITAIRDPRDVCISCFMQLFEPNDAMSHFNDLDDTTRLYDAVMDFWQQCRSIPGLSFYELRYESLVSHTKTVISELLDFLELEWDDAVMRHYCHEGYISTPSYQDIKRPIYDRSIGRWQHYNGNLSPYLERLMPYIMAYSYATV